MIRAHFYNDEKGALEGLTKQLFKHIENTRFIIDPYYDCDDFFYQGVFMHTEDVLFSLALPGGEIGRKLFSHWQQHHIENRNWYSIYYYWTDECHVPFDSPDSNIGEAYRTFFRHTYIRARKIHPIRYTASPREEIDRYTSELPSSRGIFYDPTRLYTHEGECAMPYKSNFHCAIVEVDSDGDIASARPDTGQPPQSAKYHITTHKTSRHKHITTTMETLLETPRIIIPLLGKDKAHIIKDLYYGRNTHLPAMQLILKHRNVHIFTDNPEMETTIYPNRIYVYRGSYSSHIKTLKDPGCIELPQ